MAGGTDRYFAGLLAWGGGTPRNLDPREAGVSLLLMTEEMTKAELLARIIGDEFLPGSAREEDAPCLMLCSKS